MCKSPVPESLVVTTKSCGRQLDYGARFYDASIGRFGTIDRFSEKFNNNSTYQYALNNPIKFIDMNGDSAWQVTREWNKDDGNKFSEFAKNKLDEHTKNGTKLDCADLAVSILVDYASSEGLPLTFTDADGNTIDSNSDDYNSKEEFSKSAMKTIDAKDVSANTNVIQKSDSKSGDLIILTKPANHIVNINGTTPRKLTYGNFSAGKATEVKTTGDWSNSTVDGRGRTMNYSPNSKSAHRWKVLSN